MNNEIPDGWKQRKLEDIAEQVREKYIPRKGDLKNYIGLEHIQPQTLRLSSIGCSDEIISDKYYFRKGDILFGKLRPYFRKVIHSKFDGVCSTDIWVLRPKEGIDQDFLFYMIANNEFVELSNLGEGGTRMPRAEWEFMRKTIWNIPETMTEQRAIAAVLSSLDDKIDLLHRENQTLERMAEALFRQWFVEEASEDWEEIRLGKLFDVSSGKGLKNDEIIDDGKYPVFGANGYIGRTNDYLYDEKLIYTGRVGTLGKIFIIDDEKVWLSDNTLVFRPYKYFYSVYFILKHLQLENYDVGSTQPLIRQSDIKQIKFLLPSEITLINFELETQTIFRKIKNNINQINTLEKLRDILLPKLMSGEVRVTLPEEST